MTMADKNKLETMANPCNTCGFIRRWICINGCKEYNHYLFELEKLDYTTTYDYLPHPIGEASLDNLEDYEKDDWGFYK